MNKEQLEQSKQILKDFQNNGLKAYENHKDLVIEAIKTKLQEDINFWENQHE